MKMVKKQSGVNQSSEEISFERETDCALGVTSTVRYRECQKNHAASLGGYAVDGCREFMASGEEGTSLALLCAACGCHRNFHRRVVDAEVVYQSSPSGSCSSNR